MINKLARHRLNVNLPAPLMNQLKGKVGLEGKKINEVVIRLIKDYLNYSSNK